MKKRGVIYIKLCPLKDRKESIKWYIIEDILIMYYKKTYKDVEL